MGCIQSNEYWRQQDAKMNAITVIIKMGKGLFVFYTWDRAHLANDVEKGTHLLLTKKRSACVSRIRLVGRR